MGGCLVKLVAVIPQDMFSFHNLISYIIIFEIKKNKLVLVHENHDKITICYSSPPI